MTAEKLRRALEAIAGAFEITKTPRGNYQAVSPSGEILATARTEKMARQMAAAEFARRRAGASSGGRSVRLGNTTRDIVL